MNKFLKKIKLEFFYWRKCIFEYRNFWKYIYTRYFLAKKILKYQGVLEKPINRPDLSIHILTCHKDFTMSLWSLASFYQSSSVIGQLYIHDDGSLAPKDKNIFKKLFPSCQIVKQTDIDSGTYKLDQYPETKKNRTEKTGEYFLLKKLLDPFLVSDHEKVLVIDSDLVWFKEPSEIEKEIMNGCQNSLITHNNRKTFVHFQDGSKISDSQASCNSGIVLYSKDNFNLDKLEDYFKKFDYQRPKNKHFIEQAGYAYCLENLKKLPEENYTIQRKVGGTTIVKHYTSPRRPLFYTEGVLIIKDKISL